MIENGTQIVVKAKFGRKKYLKSKTTPLYPFSAEREVKRVSDSYMRNLGDVLKISMKKISEVYKEEAKNERLDDKQDANEKVNQEIKDASRALEVALGAFGLSALMGKVALMAEKSSLSEWKRCVKNTLGIELEDGYYIGNLYNEIVQKWMSDMLGEIQDLPQRGLEEINSIIVNGIYRGLSLTEIKKQVANKYSEMKRRARAKSVLLIAMLCGSLARINQEDAGCSKYIWCTRRDSRVRECHRELEGKVCEWNNPPAMWYRHKNGQKIYTGRYCNPGEDYGCRCVGLPIFDYDNISLPIKGVYDNG